ncbi:MAG: DUF58 domain-containing protein [Pseudomonadota bacterium]
MAPIGAASAPIPRTEALHRARHRASLVPELLVEARKLVNTVIAGWHGRKKRGVGENFWQYRPYREGEHLARIDWRRSARDDQTYVRDMEWEAAHTVWVWCDLGPSMLFQSKGSRTSKEYRALVVTLALAELLGRSGERIGFPGLMRPASARNAAERLAATITNAPPNMLTSTPQLQGVQRHSEVILISDFLTPDVNYQELIADIGHRGARLHLVEVVDPAEEDFPYEGRTEFRDPVTGERLTVGRAQDWLSDYRNIYNARRDDLARSCRNQGGSYTVSRTDKLASETLVHLHGYLTGNPAPVRQRSAAG